MLTFFTTAKPFRDRSGVLQRNALKSWTLLHPDVEVILFGDEEGSAAAAREFGLRHEPHVERDEVGRKRLDAMFGKAQAIARHEALCYINCHIILMQDFCHALGRVKAAHPTFLMVGRRCDLEINEPYDFDRKDWQTRLRSLALQKAKQRTPEWIDYFAFSRGLYGPDMPPFVIGQVFWGNWLLWKAWSSKHPLVDVSPVVTAIHQNHDYGHHLRGRKDVFHGEGSGRNYKLAGGWNQLRTIADATELLRADGLKPNSTRYWAAMKRYVRQAGRALLYDVGQPIWFYLLEVTKRLLSTLGLRVKTPRRFRE
jgi:hypothetical protein